MSYEDILGLPRHSSAHHAHMTRLNRAAQFAPFAALSGHEAEIAEAGRLTEQAAELMEDEALRIDEALRWALRSAEEVELTYFVPDERKTGGACRSIRGKLMCYFGMQAAKTNTNRFNLPFSLSALADYISTDRSAMMRELKKMREEGLVEIAGRKVILHRPAC